MQFPPDPITGARRQPSGSAATEREAVRLERTFRLQAQDGASGDITLARLVEEWWASQPRLAATTRVNDRDDLDNHILPALGSRKVWELRPRLIAAFLRDLSEQRGLKPGTVRKASPVLSAVRSYAAATEYIEANPVMRVPPPEAAPSGPVAPTVEEIPIILSCRPTKLSSEATSCSESRGPARPTHRSCAGHPETAPAPVPWPSRQHHRPARLERPATAPGDGPTP
ncbi:hypothetical protein GHK86_02840 [Acidimicrobiaceae bacterium USS-CC1]|uniref:Core-binding (CB) domain-containing protein n=1 Tax=Acidiferrimicrobium australe TaxID=2664430 RepID=A0ABW9QPT3_9ACTN|nr:hypothetical protein [Acidiferrimicrobium australe]